MRGVKYLFWLLITRLVFLGHNSLCIYWQCFYQSVPIFYKINPFSYLHMRFDAFEADEFWKHCGKWRNCWRWAFSTFATMLSSLFDNYTFMHNSAFELCDLPLILFFSPMTLHKQSVEKCATAFWCLKIHLVLHNVVYFKPYDHKLRRPVDI